jgi:hypothetical protein
MIRGWVECEGRCGWSAAIPLACAVHCVATPGLVLVAPAVAASWWVEAVLMALALAVTISLVVQRARLHGSAWPWAPTGVGAALWAVELAGVAVPVPGVTLTIGGSVLLAGALVWSGILAGDHSLSRTTRSPMAIPRSAK